MRDELSIEEGLLTKGNKVCILPELYDRTLADLHDIHQGIEKMQLIARATVYWPGIDADIIDYIKRCKVCTQQKSMLAVQLMLPWDIPNGKTSPLTLSHTKARNTSWYMTHSANTLLSMKLPRPPNQYNSNSSKSSHNMNHQNVFSPTMEQPSQQKTSQMYSKPAHWIHHFIPLYLKSKVSIKWQVKTIKTALAATNFKVHH